MTTIVIEDGTGVSGSNSFISVADARLLATASARGSLWGDDDSDAEALVIAYRHFTSNYEHRVDQLTRWHLSGRRKSETQTGCFPRVGAFYVSSSPIEKIPEDSVPSLALDIQVEMASIFHEEGNLEIVVDPEELNLKRKNLGRGAIDRTWATTSSADPYLRTTSSLDGMLSRVCHRAATGPWAM